MPDAHKNFAVSEVATVPSPAVSGTSLALPAGHGSRFPAVPFNATIWADGEMPDPTNAEIVRVTNNVTDILTITRAQESTSARTVIVGDQIAATVTAKTLTDVESESVILAPASSARNVIQPSAGADALHIPNAGGDIAAICLGPDDFSDITTLIDPGLVGVIDDNGNDVVVLRSVAGATAALTVSPGDGAVIAAVVKAHAAQSVDLTQWQKSDGTVLASVGLDGLLTVSPVPGVSGIDIRSSDSPSDFTDIFQLFNDGSVGTFLVRIDTGGQFFVYGHDANSTPLNVAWAAGLVPDPSGYLVSLAGSVGRFAILGTGHPLLRDLHAAPADGNFNEGEIVPWFDPTNGAAKFMLKGKTADGTVVTWAIPNGTSSVVGHVHSGADITSGTVADARIDAAIARDSEVTAAVAAEASARTTADGLLVPKSLYDANTVLAANSDDTPAALTMGASTILARLAAGNIKAATPAELRTLLALVVGTDVQAFDAELAAIAGLTSAADKIAYFTGSGTAAVADFTTAARALLDDTTAASMLTTLGAQPALITTNVQTASYTLVLGDAGLLVEMNVASANNLTVPLNSSVAYPVGTVIAIHQYGAGQTSVVATGGVTIRSPSGKLKLTGQYSSGVLRKRATDEWVLAGDLSA